MYFLSYSSGDFHNFLFNKSHRFSVYLTDLTTRKKTKSDFQIQAVLKVSSKQV